MLDKLKQFLQGARKLRADVRALKSKTVNQKHIRERAEQIGTKWCGEISEGLKANGGFDDALLERYRSNFSRLITLSGPSNRRTSYLSVLDAGTKYFRRDLILPIQQGSVAVSPKASSFDAFLSKIAASDEGEYFKEALSCAKHSYLRAATVMGWCAAIDRIHRTIDHLGFMHFNVTSAKMASQTAGRFKKFNQNQHVNSLSELREVFDTTVLWIIEGMELIDSNQHTRLRSCFDMRCQAAHPGEAPATEYNLLSFFSDIDQIVLSNPKFASPTRTPLP